MNELALFAGAGGGLLATTHLLGWRAVCYVEWDEYCVSVIKQRIKDGYLHDAPIWDDVRTFDGAPWRGCVDIVTAGFPCQPFSVAGKQQAEDDRRNMWPDTIRIVRECQPCAVLLENVPGLVSSGYILTVLDDLAQAGYKAFPPVRLAAGDVGANHQRKRIWILAYAELPEWGQSGAERCDLEWETRSIQGGREEDTGGTRIGGSYVADAETYGLERPERENGKSQRGKPKEGWLDTIGSRQNVAHAEGQSIGTGLCQSEPPEQWRGRPSDGGGERCIWQREWWATEPRLGRVANGVAHRVDRLKAIGNGQVPAVVAAVWRLLTEDF